MNPTTKKISIAKDFSRFPAGRFCADSLFCGESLRKNILIPFINQGNVLIDLDGTLGYGSSFLQEAFGKLREHFSLSFIQERLEVKSKTDQSLVNEIWEYIKQNPKEGYRQCN